MIGPATFALVSLLLLPHQPGGPRETRALSGPFYT
jgi:hypothetical protein